MVGELSSGATGLRQAKIRVSGSGIRSRLNWRNYRLTVEPNTLGANAGNVRLRYIGTEHVKTGGRLGSQATRVHVADVATELERRGWTITGGGGRLPEEYLKPLGGGRRGGSYVDITATKDGRTLRINTIDTLGDNATPTSREIRNAARIRQQQQLGEHLILVPKP